MNSAAKHHLTWTEARQLAVALLPTINSLPRIHSAPFEPYRAYGVPRGGCNAVQLFDSSEVIAVDYPMEADFLFDDIIDSGKTRKVYAGRYGQKPFLALIDKTAPYPPEYSGWIVFPWEAKEEEGPEDNVRRILQHIGENPDREGLIETPKRFLKMFREMTCGYGEDPSEHLLKRFTLDDSAEGISSYDAIIFTGPLPFVSMCEHHLAAFDGVAFMGYIPDKEGGIVGLSKLARLLNGYAQRLQVQERLTVQIIDAIEKVLQPKASAVVIRARHTCQCFRGVKKDGRMITSAMRGAFRESGTARAEFFELIRLAESGLK